MDFDLDAISSKFRVSEYVIHPHADTAMQDDNVSAEFVVEAIGRDSPQIIARYTYSCLILGWGLPNEPLHALVALGTVNQEYDTPMLITIYRPDRDTENRWMDDYATRRK